MLCNQFSPHCEGGACGRGVKWFSPERSSETSPEKMQNLHEICSLFLDIRTLNYFYLPDFQTGHAVRQISRRLKAFWTRFFKGQYGKIGNTNMTRNDSEYAAAVADTGWLFCEIWTWENCQSGFVLMSLSSKIRSWPRVPAPSGGPRN